MLRKLQLQDNNEEKEKLLHEFTLHGIAKYILDGKAKNIVTMAGAGISTCSYYLIVIANYYY